MEEYDKLDAVDQELGGGTRNALHPPQALPEALVNGCDKYVSIHEPGNTRRLSDTENFAAGLCPPARRFLATALNPPTMPPIAG